MNTIKDFKQLLEEEKVKTENLIDLYNEKHYNTEIYSHYLAKASIQRILREINAYLDVYNDESWEVPDDEYMYLVNIFCDRIKHLANLKINVIHGQSIQDYEVERSVTCFELNILQNSFEFKEEHKFLKLLLGRY